MSGVILIWIHVAVGKRPTVLAVRRCGCHYLQASSSSNSTSTLFSPGNPVQMPENAAFDQGLFAYRNTKQNTVKSRNP